MFHSHFDARLHPWLLSLFLAAFSMTVAPAAEATEGCEPLLPVDTHRRPEGAVAETHCYRLDLPSAGLLHLDLSVAGWSASRPRLAVAGAAALRTVERSATEWLAIAPAGSYLLEVSAEDPRRPLPAYRLSSRFLEWTKSETDGELELDPETLRSGGFGPEHSETDGELELDPETLRGGAGTPPRIACLDAGPEKSETDGELELDPETSRAAGPGSLCQGGDDHGDSRACATPIEGSSGGELGNGWGDDADVFRFRLCGWRTLEIASAGDADTHGQLFDRRGQLLAGDDDGGEGANFRLVRTLGPGTYFVRVEGVQQAGVYALELATIDR